MRRKGHAPATWLAFASEEYSPCGGAHDLVVSGPDRDVVEDELLEYCYRQFTWAYDAEPATEPRWVPVAVTGGHRFATTASIVQGTRMIDGAEHLFVEGRPAQPAGIAFHGRGHLARLDHGRHRLLIISSVECDGTGLALERCAPEPV